MRAEVDYDEGERDLKALASLMVSDPDTRKRVVKMTRRVLQEARKNISKDVKAYLDSDPRRAYLAVKSSVYRKIIGGNVSIFNPRRAGRRCEIVRERKLDANPHQRGGNRRPRSARTDQVDGYYGKDRAFILRFLNSGTAERVTRYGSRGSLRERRVFEWPAHFHMQWAGAQLVSQMVHEIEAAFNEKIR